MKRLRILWTRGAMGFDDFEDEEVIGIDEARVVESAFEIGEAFADERGGDHFGWFVRQMETGELVHLVAGAVANADHGVDEIGGGDVEHAFAAFADHLEAGVASGNDAANQRGSEFHDGVPAHGHDIGPPFPSRADENDRARLKDLADVGDGEVLFRERLRKTA